MQGDDAGSSFPDSVEVSIRKVENGYVCRVMYPKHLISDPVVEKAQDVLSALGKAKEGENPEDVFKVFGNLFVKLKRTPRPLRKPEETYIFQNTETLLQFVKETFEASEASEAKSESSAEQP